MAIQIPSPRTELRPGGLGTPTTPTGPSQARDVAAGLQNAAQSAQRVENSLLESQIQLQVKRNAERVFTAEQELETWRRDFTTKVQNERRGSNAAGLQEHAVEQWDTTVNRLADGLENDAQREAFSRAAAPRQNMSLDSLATFESRQLDIAFAEGAEGRIQSYTSLAAENPRSADARSYARNEIIATVEAVSRTMGRPTEGENNFAHQLALKTALTGLHRQVFENLLENPEEAKAYFEANKAEIDGQLWEQFEAKIEEADFLVAAQEGFDSLALEFGTDWEAMNKAANDRYEGRVQDDIQRRVANAQNRANAAEATRIDEIENTAYDYFTQNGHSVDRLQRALPQIWHDLPGTTKLALQNQERNFLSGTTETNSEAFVALWTLASNPQTHDQFLDINIPLEYGHEMSVGDRNLLLNMREAIVQGRGSSVRTDTQIINDAAALLETNDDKYRFIQTIQARANAEQEAGGGQPVTPKRLEEIVNEEMMQFVFDSWWPLDERPISAFELLDEDVNLKSVYIPGTDTSGADIEKFLRENGEEPTRENIRRMMILMSGGPE